MNEVRQNQRAQYADSQHTGATPVRGNRRTSRRRRFRALASAPNRARPTVDGDRWTVMDVGHWLLNFFGISNLSGYGYGFFSGVGSDLGEVALIGAIIAIYRRHNCHVQRCWRISRHPVDGTPWVVCRKHHPTIGKAPTADQVLEDHRLAHQQAS